MNSSNTLRDFFADGNNVSRLKTILSFNPTSAIPHILQTFHIKHVHIYVLLYFVNYTYTQQTHFINSSLSLVRFHCVRLCNFYACITTHHCSWWCSLECAERVSIPTMLLLLCAAGCMIRIGSRS